MCYPKEEGGIGLRSLNAVSNALFAKLWWNFRTSTSSMWGEYMWNKYCKKLHPIMAKGCGASHVWRKMQAIKEEIKHNIWWPIKAGNSSVWFDNWTRQGALYYIEGEDAREEELEVRDFTRGGEWDRQKLRDKLYEEMTVHIVENIVPPADLQTRDKVKCNTDGACRGNPGMSALSFCSINLKEVTIETDSPTLKMMIEREWKVPGDLIEMIEGIRVQMQLVQANIKHIYREGHTVADSLANEVVDTQDTKEYQSFYELPAVAGGSRISRLWVLP
ncbi:hypothetical protein MTR67_013082 [Solanum verrucosum]|uniref:RNase H type-1 domain-containing protein n=1 Tax=Solanum verrucosum TaxID=315347 RepID=A0AAF0QB35_SOLVR|nr:hypothetical protein MTR67_013082 [Solanum verrucosum]